MRKGIARAIYGLAEWAAWRDTSHKAEQHVSGQKRVAVTSNKGQGQNSQNVRNSAGWRTPKPSIHPNIPRAGFTFGYRGCYYGLRLGWRTSNSSAIFVLAHFPSEEKRIKMPPPALLKISCAFCARKMTCTRIFREQRRGQCANLTMISMSVSKSTPIWQGNAMMRSILSLEIGC